MKLVPTVLYIYITFFFLCCNQKPQKTKSVPYTDQALTMTDTGLIYNGVRFSGVVYGLYANKDSMFSESYHNGLPNGPFSKWYHNGQKMEIVHFNMGKECDTFRGWWENGKKRVQYQYINNEITGALEEWYPNGIRKQRLNFRKGKEDGMQSLWTIDGRPHMSYNVINNKAYFLTRTKNCFYVP